MTKRMLLLLAVFLLATCQEIDNALIAKPLDVAVAAETLLELKPSQAQLQGSCFSFGDCHSCLNNAKCGWCADGELCYEGGETGPSCGSAITSPCTLWVFKETTPALGLGARAAMCGFAQLQQMFKEVKTAPRNLD